MPKTNVQQKRHNEIMAFSIANLANEADIPTTDIVQIDDESYQISPYTIDTSKDAYLVEGLEHNYLLTAGQHKSLYNNEPFKTNIQIADSEQLVKGIIAFQDIYLKMELQEEFNQTGVVPVAHLSNHFQDEENSCYIGQCQELDCILAKQANKVTKAPIGVNDSKVIMEYDNGK